jgi:hypothetical protein
VLLIQTIFILSRPVGDREQRARTIQKGLSQSIRP